MKMECVGQSYKIASKKFAAELLDDPTTAFLIIDPKEWKAEAVYSSMSYDS